MSLAKRVDRYRLKSDKENSMAIFLKNLSIPAGTLIKEINFGRLLKQIRDEKF